MSRTNRYTRQWLRPMKLREYYVDQFVTDVRDAEYQLYWAVVDGNIRARHGGRLLTIEERYALRNTSWSSVKGDLYALPPDLELSVEDAKHIWMEVALPESLTRMLDAGNANAQPDGGPSEQRRLPRSQPERERAKGALAALYPKGVPDQGTLSDAWLYKAVGDWCQRNKQPDIKRDTLLRAAGRRK
jgi:hypothetical protein